MRFLILVFALVASTAAKSTTKPKKDTKSSVKNSTSPPAVIAIEIVDPNENTTSKNSKRTIESSLGYGGYSSYSPPKYEVYKYSQHDIPPYRGSSFTGHTGSIGGQIYDIQKSISYDLGKHTYEPEVSYYKSSGYSHTSSSPNLNSYYQPGTTLYTTLNNQGQVSHLTSNVPSQAVGGQVPVIILRVYPNQLTGGASGGLFAKLPQSHPFASDVNSINLQELLVKYVQGALQNTPKKQPQVYQTPQVNSYQPGSQSGHDYSRYYTSGHSQGPNQYYTQSYHQYQQPNYQYHHRYEVPTVYNHVHVKQSYQDVPKLPTYENYPDDVHTRVVFKENLESQQHHHTPTQAPAVSASPAYGKQEEEHGHDYNYEGDSHDDDQSGYYYQKPSQQQQGFYPEVVDNYKQKESPQSFRFDISQFLPTQFSASDNYQEEDASIPPEANDGPEEPFNYHAHPNGRAKKNVGRRSGAKKASRDKREHPEK